MNDKLTDTNSALFYSAGWVRCQSNAQLDEPGGGTGDMGIVGTVDSGYKRAVGMAAGA